MQYVSAKEAKRILNINATTLKSWKDKGILKYIEDKIGYDKKYLIKCLNKNIINYSTATYYLKYKEKMNETEDDSIILDDN